MRFVTVTQSHTGHRPFQCSVCHQNFSEAATLAQHMRRHTRESGSPISDFSPVSRCPDRPAPFAEPYACDFPGCGKAFAIAGALTIHKRTHNGSKPFKCSYCERAFSESSNLSKHVSLALPPLGRRTLITTRSCGRTPGRGRTRARSPGATSRSHVRTSLRDTRTSTSGRPWSGERLSGSVLLLADV